MAGDRELDCFLAEQLFGRTIEYIGNRTPYWREPESFPKVVPDYTEHGWTLVAEAMAERKYMLTLQRDIGAPMVLGKGGQWVRSDLYWEAQYEKGSLDDRLQGRGIWRATADTPGLAVCRAARAALEAAKED